MRSTPSLGAWTYVWYSVSGSQRVILDADVTLSVTNIVSLADLDRLMTHEWGHAIGLDHSNTESAVMAGPPATHYNALVTPQADDLRGCRCQYGLPSGVSAAYACSVPPKVDFGNAAVGSTSATQSVTFTNSGNAPLSIQSATVAGTQFRHVAGCAPGTVVMPGASCSLQMQAAPSSSGAVASQLALFTNDGFYEIALAANGVSGTTTVGGPTVEVVEYYNAALDHYFITWIAAEMANLDAGLTPTRWTRTGRTFKAFAASQSATSQVCRFYIPPDGGRLALLRPRRRRVQRDAAGATRTSCSRTRATCTSSCRRRATCPAGTQPIYRVFNNRPDANHRYTIDRAVRDQMVAQGLDRGRRRPGSRVMCAARIDKGKTLAKLPEAEAGRSSARLQNSPVGSLRVSALSICSRLINVPLQLRPMQDRRRDLLDRLRRRVEHRDPLARHQRLGLAHLEAAVVERRVLAARPPLLANLAQPLGLDGEAEQLRACAATTDPGSR